MFRRILCLTLMIFIISCQCPGAQQLGNIQAGSIDLALKNDGMTPTSMFMKTFDDQFNSIPMIGLSTALLIIAIHDFIINSFSIRRWILTAQQVTQNSFVVKFEFEGSQWSKMQVGFWATTRSDIILGTGSACTGCNILELGQTSNSIKTVSFNFSKPTIRGSIVRVFLNGLVSEVISSIDIKIVLKNLSANGFEAKVMVGQGLRAKQLYVSFISFNPRRAVFASYGAAVMENRFSGNKLIDLHKSIYNTPFVFMGFASFKISGGLPLEFSTSVDDEMFLELSSSRVFDQFTLTYVVIGVNPRIICGGCPEKFIYQNQCLNKCPQNTYEFKYGNGAMSCKKCAQRFNFAVDSNINGCVCKNNFQAINGICQLSKELQSTNNRFDQSFVPSPPSMNPSQVSSDPPTVDVPRTPEQPSSFTPTMPVNQMQRTVEPIPRAKYVVKDCSGIQNSYWTGYRCACRVGFTSQNGLCVRFSIEPPKQIFRPAEFIYKISKLYSVINCQDNEQFDGEKCACVEGFYRSAAGTCEPIIECPPRSIFINGNCVCNSGFVLRNNQCLKQCPSNSADNGLGQCVCDSGYFLSNDGTCMEGEECPPFSYRNDQNACVCVAGYIDIGGFCSRCEEGQIYSEKDQRCILPCGVNQEALNGICRCKEGLGKFLDVCQQCPTDFFVKDNFCASCPVRSTLNPVTGQCECENGLVLNQLGFCESRCPGANSEFDSQRQSCICTNGLGFVNGRCTVCAFGVDPATVECKANCGASEIRQNNGCVCREGLGRNANNVCVDCAAVSGGIEVDGVCGICPPTFIVSNNACICRTGSSEVNGLCVEDCAPQQLKDADGLCYVCPLNQAPVNGQCQCIDGYESNGQICSLVCPADQVVVNGLCAICASGTAYNPELSSCVCPPGFYRNNLGVCEQNIQQIINCGPGFYFSIFGGCQPCSSPCLECPDQFSCTRCPEFYQLSGSSCLPICGDSFALPNVEQCDDGNAVPGDGCENCRVAAGWQCIGILPSICSRINTGPQCGDGKVEGTENCDDNNTANGDGCSSICAIEEGYNCTGAPSSCLRINRGFTLISAVAQRLNTFIEVDTDQAFQFGTEEEMRAFIKPEYPTPNVVPASHFCLQDSVALRRFQCLFIFSTSIPREITKFLIDLTYSRGGVSGFLRVELTNPSPNNAISARSLL